MDFVKSGKEIMGLMLGLTVLMSAGCTYPAYDRTVVRTYDENGRLMGTVVTEHLTQRDPTSRPLMGVLRQQSYEK